MTLLPPNQRTPFFLTIIAFATLSACVSEDANEGNSSTCPNGQCDDQANQPCKTPGFVRCDGICIDPLKSRSFCGATANCTAYKACNSDETCQEGECISTACPANHHDYQDRCEPDSLNHCGEHNNRCATQIDGWVNGECSNGQCSATQCMDSFHLYMNSCERDSVEHCGEHDLDCRNIMPGFSDGHCIDKTCVATTCFQDYHLYHNACEPDNETHCGQHTTDCHNLLGYNTGVCVDSACKILTCVVGYHLDSTNNRCVEDKTYKVGDIILFGSYFQSNATTKEPI